MAGGGAAIFSEMFLKLWDNGLIQKGVWETVYMTVLASALSYCIGLPLGVILNITDKEGINPVYWLNRALGLIVNFFRSIPFIILMCLGTDFVIRLWIGNAVTIPYTLSIAMGLFVFFQSAYCMYSNLVNGIGKVKIQLISFLVTGLVAIPCIEQATRYLGLWGCLLLPTIAYAIIALLCRYQVKRVTY